MGYTNRQGKGKWAVLGKGAKKCYTCHSNGPFKENVLGILKGQGWGKGNKEGIRKVYRVGFGHTQGGWGLGEYKKVSKPNPNLSTLSLNEPLFLGGGYVAR